MESISMFGRTSLTFSTGIYNQNPELQMLHALIYILEKNQETK